MSLILFPLTVYIHNAVMWQSQTLALHSKILFLAMQSPLKVSQLSTVCELPVVIQ